FSLDPLEASRRSSVRYPPDQSTSTNLLSLIARMISADHFLAGASAGGVARTCPEGLVGDHRTGRSAPRLAPFPVNVSCCAPCPRVRPRSSSTSCLVVRSRHALRHAAANRAAPFTLIPDNGYRAAGRSWPWASGWELAQPAPDRSPWRSAQLPRQY